MGVRFIRQKGSEIPGAHQIGAAISGRIAGEKITDMRLFLSYYHNVRGNLSLRWEGGGKGHQMRTNIFQRFRKGVVGRGLATNRPPKTAEKRSPVMCPPSPKGA